MALELKLWLILFAWFPATAANIELLAMKCDKKQKKLITFHGVSLIEQIAFGITLCIPTAYSTSYVM